MLFLSSARARAEDFAFAHFLGGAALPLGDRTWNRSVGLSPTGAAQIGGMRGRLGGMVSADWTFEQLTSNNALLPPTVTRDSGRLRVLGHIVVEDRWSSKLTFDAYAGAGVDVQFVDYSTPIGPTHHSDVFEGLAFEVGAAAWWRVGIGLHLGGVLALPISDHSTERTGGAFVGFNYTSFELAILVGLRVTTSRD